MSDEPTDARALTRAPKLLKFPGENPILHESVQWWESTKTKLATSQLIKSANGKDPDAALRIIDTPLSEIPDLDPNDRDFNRRQELRVSMFASKIARIALTGIASL